MPRQVGFAGASDLSPGELAIRLRDLVDASVVKSDNLTRNYPAPDEPAAAPLSDQPEVV